MRLFVLLSQTDHNTSLSNYFYPGWYIRQVSIIFKTFGKSGDDAAWRYLVRHAWANAHDRGWANQSDRAELSVNKGIVLQSGLQIGNNDNSFLTTLICFFLCQVGFGFCARSELSALSVSEILPFWRFDNVDHHRGYGARSTRGGTAFLSIYLEADLIWETVWANSFSLRSIWWIPWGAWSWLWVFKNHHILNFFLSKFFSESLYRTMGENCWWEFWPQCGAGFSW